MWSQNQLLWQQQQWAAAAAASAIQQQTPAAQGPPSSAVPAPVSTTESNQEDTDKTKASGWAAKASQWAQQRQAQEQYAMWQQQQQQQQQMIALQQQQQQMAALQHQQQLAAMQQHQAHMQQFQQQQAPAPTQQPAFQQQQQQSIPGLQQQQQAMQQLPSTPSQHQAHGQVQSQHQQFLSTPSQNQLHPSMQGQQQQYPSTPAQQHQVGASIQQGVQQFHPAQHSMVPHSTPPQHRPPSQSPRPPAHPSPGPRGPPHFPTNRPPVRGQSPQSGRPPPHGLGPRGSYAPAPRGPRGMVPRGPPPPFARGGQRFRPPFQQRRPQVPFRTVRNPEFHDGPRPRPPPHPRFRGPPSSRGPGNYRPMWNPDIQHPHPGPDYYSGEVPPTEAMFGDDSYPEDNMYYEYQEEAVNDQVADDQFPEELVPSQEQVMPPAPLFQQSVKIEQEQKPPSSEIQELSSTAKSQMPAVSNLANVHETKQLVDTKPPLTSQVSDTASVSSVSTVKSTKSTSIPGLDLADSSSVKDESPAASSGGHQSTDVMASLGKIVSQLQFLKSSQSTSFKALVNIPGVQEKRAEIEESEEVKRKVAALLKEESDSDGEGKEPVPDSVPNVPEMSPPARDFEAYVNPEYYDRRPGYSQRPTEQPYPSRDYPAPPPRGGNQFNREADWERERAEPRGRYDHNPEQQPWGDGFPRHRREGEYDRYYQPDHQPPHEPWQDRDRLPPRRSPPPMRRSPPPMRRSPPPMRRSPPPRRSSPPRRSPPRRSPPPSHWEDYPTSRPLPHAASRGREVYEESYPPHEGHGYPPPLVPPPERQIAPPQEEDFGYSHSTSVLSAIKTVDYNHGQAAQDRYSELAPHSRDYPPYESYGNDPYGAPQPSMHAESFTPEQLFSQYQHEFTGNMDPAAFLPQMTGENRRKGLPLWIREQLEKIKEKEQLEREVEAARRQAEHTGHSSWRDELDEEEDDHSKSKRGGESGSPTHRRHANYRSHSSNRSDEDDSDGIRNRVRQSSQRAVHISSEDDEERQLHLISKVRRMLTEVLLDVTSSEMKQLTKEAIEEAKKPKQYLPETERSKKANSKTLLGLSIYSSESEDEFTLDPNAVANAFQGKETGGKSSNSSKDSKSKSKSKKKDKERSSKWDSKKKEKKDRKEKEPASVPDSKAVQDKSTSPSVVERIVSTKVTKRGEKLGTKMEPEKETKWRPLDEPIKFTICQSDSIARVGFIKKPPSSTQPTLPAKRPIEDPPTPIRKVPALSPFQQAIQKASQGFRSNSPPKDKSRSSSRRAASTERSKKASSPERRTRKFSPERAGRPFPPERRHSLERSRGRQASPEHKRRPHSPEHRGGRPVSSDHNRRGPSPEHSSHHHNTRNRHRSRSRSRSPRNGSHSKHAGADHKHRHRR